jgi:two-component system cell cycle sensor histidine kinase/response regulator CckA
LIDLALAEARFDRVIEVVTTASEGLTRIQADEHDIYLVDYRLPDGTGLQLIHDAKAAGTSKPFILMTGFGSEALDDAALTEGAADYVEKHLLSTHLERSIRYALRDWQADRTLRDREEQLRQAQKMEAIGRLAGGVAHDFNNLLTAIVGYTDLITERLDPEDQTARDVREIRKAADRASSLTRQLLAFSRKQFLKPVPMDLNEAVTGILQMLPRVIGEHIQTVTRLSPSLGRINADPSQIEQVIVNLVLNARDAMPGGGIITVETANVENSVMLAVIDTGTGMDAETRSHVFEPFFTTKPKGKGTGLGLATVYGIVEQSGGHITVDTAVGRGTTIRIFFPLVTEPVVPREPDRVPTNTYGTETVLLVEDNDAVRELARRALGQRGYAVIEARNGEEAIDLLSRLHQPPHLLVTDVVMPGLSGPNLAARLLQQHPRLRILYMSGYSEDSAAGHGSFWGGVPLLQKPFTPSQLAERVRMTLDATSNQA